MGIRHSFHFGGLEDLIEDSFRTMDGSNREFAVGWSGILTSANARLGGPKAESKEDIPARQGQASRTFPMQKRAKLRVLCYLPRGEKTNGTNISSSSSARD